jgi:DNA polymerase I-like protein with 3'-5' exonuclease and polymerase domains
MQRSVENGKRDGYVKTLLGRRRELQELKKQQFQHAFFRASEDRHEHAQYRAPPPIS